MRWLPQLCACATSGKYPVEKIWLLSTLPVLQGTCLWLHKGRWRCEMSGRWGRGYSSTSTPGSRSSHTQAVLFAPSLMISGYAPQSIGTIVKKCKTVAVITHGIIQKAMSRWEWATSRFTLPNSPSISTEPSWKGGWDLEESEHCLSWVDEGVQPAVA